MAVAFATSIPMYADGALKRVVAESLQQKSSGLPAGSLANAVSITCWRENGFNGVDRSSKGILQKDVPKEIGFPFDTYVKSYSIRSAEVTPEDPTKVDAGRNRQLSIMTMSGLEKKTELTQGRWFVNAEGDGRHARSRHVRGSDVSK